MSKALGALVQKYGPYSAHNIRLADGIYTMNDRVNFDHFKLNRIKQIVADLGLLQKNRALLDIASLESMFAIEFALEGLNVISIEGRESNLERGKFAAQALGLKRLAFHQDDVNNISSEKYGTFDVVLCMGILYHISKEKYARFLANVAACCKEALIIDTFVSLRGREVLEWEGVRYRGTTWREFDDSAGAEEKKGNLHAALSDNFSFSMSKESLMAFLQTLGFTSVLEAHVPFQPNGPRDRVTLVCKKGKAVALKVFPAFDHKISAEAVVDTRGIGGRQIVHWNENPAMRGLRRSFRLLRRQINSLRRKQQTQKES
ncbi:MAG: class I SAM-dependent methyltransferase [bacterium]